MLLNKKIVSIVFLFVLLSGILINFSQKQDDQKEQQLRANVCLSYLPYTEYPKWYGLEGKDIKGKKFLPGHAIQRHIAVNNACTAEQKKQNKTVFLSLLQFQKAANQIPVLCDIPNRTTFTYDYDGKIASATNYINGIDCKTGNQQKFPGYFVQFKRAIRNANPLQQDYLNSNYVTIWTLYPKRLSMENSKSNNLQKNDI